MEQLENKPWLVHYKNQPPINIPEASIYALLEEAEKQYGRQTAIIFEDKKITYTQLKERVDRLARTWMSMGCQKGERIGLMLTNHPDYILSYYAAQAAGLIVVQINPNYTRRELLQILQDSQVSYMVIDSQALKVIDQIRDIYPFQWIAGSKIQEDSHTVFIYPIEEMINQSQTKISPVQVDAREDVAVIQYTGGTTGKMKGAMLTHFNLMSNVIQSFMMYGESMILGKETILAATPLYHVYAMTSAMNLGIYIAAKLLLIRKFEVNNVLESIKRYQPTFFPGVPRMYNAFINHPKVEQYGLDCLKICSCGSAPLPIEVMKRFESLTGAVIAEGFGLSEASPSTHRNPSNGLRKVGSIGIPMPQTDCLIVDENNQVLGPKSTGELLIRGPQVMKGYWNNEKETKRAIQNGWLYTGDLATMDEDGYFYIVGRKKEMIIMSGFNIYPQEIEDVLYEYPDVKEAAVVGLPHKEYGEVVKAYVVPKDNQAIDVEELRGYCYTRLTPYKVPKSFDIRDSLPRNTVGKLLKRLLIKEEMEKGEWENAN